MLSDSQQQADGGSLAPVTQEKPVSPLTFVIIHQQHHGADNQGIKAGRPGEILSPDVKKKDARDDLSPSHCQEFNFTQLTSARDK